MSQLLQPDARDRHSRRADIATKIAEKKHRHLKPGDEEIWGGPKLSALEEWAFVDPYRPRSSVSSEAEEEELSLMPNESSGPNDSDYPKCLNMRRVWTEPSRLTSNLNWVKDLMDPGPRDNTGHSDEDAIWQDDYDLADEGNEIEMLATIGMSILDRSYVRNTNKLLFALSTIWADSSLLPATSGRAIKRASPDIAIGFRPSQAFDYDYRGFDTPGLCASPGGRVHFPFFMIELKSHDGSLKVARLQNLNNASVALSMMHRWWRAAYREKEFFDQAWVVTASMTPTLVEFRSHWCTTEKGQVFYEHADMGRINIDRSPWEAKQVFKKIYSDFGMKRLLPRLQEVVKQVVASSDIAEIASANSTPLPGVKRRAPLSSTSGIDAERVRPHPKVAPTSGRAKGVVDSRSEGKQKRP